jgi:hypothetical protein
MSRRRGYSFRNSSGIFAIFTAMRRASSRVSGLAALCENARDYFAEQRQQNRGR